MKNATTNNSSLTPWTLVKTNSLLTRGPHGPARAPITSAQSQDSAPTRKRTLILKLIPFICFVHLYPAAAFCAENQQTGAPLSSSTVLVTGAATNFPPTWCGDTGLLFVNRDDQPRLAYVDVQTKAIETISPGQIQGPFFCSHDGLLVFFEQLIVLNPDAFSWHTEGPRDILVLDRKTKTLKTIGVRERDLFDRPLSPTQAIAVAAGITKQEAALNKQQLASVLKGWKIMTYWLASKADYRVNNVGVWSTDGKYFVVPNVARDGEQDRNRGGPSC